MEGTTCRCQNIHCLRSVRAAHSARGAFARAARTRCPSRGTVAVRWRFCTLIGAQTCANVTHRAGANGAKTSTFPVMRYLKTSEAAALLNVSPNTLARLGTPFRLPPPAAFARSSPPVHARGDRCPPRCAAGRAVHLVCGLTCPRGARRRHERARRRAQRVRPAPRRQRDRGSPRAALARPHGAGGAAQLARRGRPPPRDRVRAVGLRRALGQQLAAPRAAARDAGHAVDRDDRARRRHARRARPGRRLRACARAARDARRRARARTLGARRREHVRGARDAPARRRDHRRRRAVGRRRRALGLRRAARDRARCPSRSTAAARSGRACAPQALRCCRARQERQPAR